MSLREKLVRNVDEVALETFERAPLYSTRCGRVIGPDTETVALKLGCGYDEVPPGQRSCPYHFHYAQEEMFVILGGEGTLRVADEMIPVRSGDVICIPAGPEYPHQLINTGATTLRYLSISTQEYPEVCEYPDSGKYAAYARAKGPMLQGHRMHRSDGDLDYWDGEP